MTNFRLSLALYIIGSMAHPSAAEPTPFQLAGKLIIVRAIVDGQPGNFILDTGIPHLVLNARYFEGEPTARVFHGLNGQAGNIAVSHPSLRIGAHSWEEEYAEVIPMLQLESQKGIPIHGLLGTEIFRDHLLVLDYQKLELELYPLDKRGESTELADGTPPSEVLPFKLKGSTPLVALHVGDTELKLVIDTGAEMNLMADKHLKKLSHFIGKQRQQNFCGFGSQAQQATLTQLSGLRTGLFAGKAMNTAFGNLGEFNRYVTGPVADGIIGYEFLCQFRVAFNFKKREMYLWELEGGLTVGN